MKTPQQIQAVKQTPITAYLSSLGIEPAQAYGRQLVYHSPKTDERTPSFYVDPDKNVFNDFSGDERGDVIRLVRYLTGCSFMQAVERLERLEICPTTRSFSFSGQRPISEEKAAQIVNVKPLTHRALLAYVESRKIVPELASRYLKEVDYTASGKRYYAVGFENDKGGFELRNAYFKGATAPKGVTTFSVNGSQSVCLFEGTFDFVAALQHFGKVKFDCTTIVLNSLSNLKSVLPLLDSFATVYTFLDNDEPGRRAVVSLQGKGLNVVDYSHLYQPHKDFNDFVIDCRTPKHQKSLGN